MRDKKARTVAPPEGEGGETHILARAQGATLCSPRVVAWAIRCQDAKLATRSIIRNMQRQKNKVGWAGLGLVGEA